MLQHPEEAEGWGQKGKMDIYFWIIEKKSFDEYKCVPKHLNAKNKNKNEEKMQVLYIFTFVKLRQ